MRADRFARAVLVCLPLLGVSCNEGFDLVIEALTVPHSVLPGDPFTTQSRVCNRSDEPTGFASLDLLLRPLSPPGADVLLGGRGIPPLDPGQCHTEVSELFAPQGLPDGAHQLVGRVVPDGHQLASAVFGIGHLPNLVVESLDAPPGVVPSGNFPVNGLLCNRGTIWAASTFVRLYLSTDAQLVGMVGGGMPDLFLGEAYVPGLPPDACLPFQLEAPSAPDEGLYLLGAIADELGDVSELIEDDNARMLDLIAVGWLPDLVVASLNAPNATQSGDEFEAEGVVCNQGTVPSPPSQLALYFSDDGVIAPPGPPPAPADVPLGNLPIPSLEPGACRTQRGLVGGSVPYDGAWTLGALVDEAGVIEELLEVNNSLAGPLIGVGYGPDLVVESIAAPPSAVPANEFLVTTRVCNRGTGHASSSLLRLFHSSDGVLDLSPFDPDPEIGVQPVPSLPPDNCADVYALASSALTGAVTLFALADGFDMVPELLEGNNEKAGPQMGIGYGPDLVVESIAAPPSVGAGAPFDVTVKVCNQGLQQSSPTGVWLYHSVDTAISGGGPLPGLDWNAGAIDLLPPLNAGACVSLSVTAYSDSAAQGAYYLGAIVDEADWIDELIETNNVRVGPLMGVGAAPDLLVTLLEAPPSGLPGASLPLDFEVCNQGTTGSFPSEVSFYLSPDASAAQAPVPDGWLGSETVPSLAPGACHAGAALGWLPSGELGEVWLSAAADSWDSVDELVEANNVRVGPVLGVGNGPDLVVAQLLAQPSVEMYGTLAVDTQVCNQGTASSPPAELFLYLSADTDVQGSYFMPHEDPYLASVYVPALAPGSCHDEQALGIAAVSYEGPWYVGGIVDEGTSVSELVESNNEALGNRVGVGPYPDLVIAALSGPSSVVAGESFFVDVEVCNQGTSASESAVLMLYHSEDDSIDGVWDPAAPVVDAVLAEIWLPVLAAGSCHAELKSVVATQAGPGFLAATADEQNYVIELIEGNNERLGPALEVTPAP
jgi:subtilase family serine protease